MSIYYEIENYYANLGDNLDAVIYRPKEMPVQSRIGIVLMHSDTDYLGFLPAPELAKRGYTVITSRVRNDLETLDEKLCDVREVLSFLRNMRGIEKTVLLGHSGGATLMSAYQAAAENGTAYFQDDRKIIKLSDIGFLPEADALMLLDSNWGNGVMTLLSLEPGITDETSSRNLLEEYNLFSEEHGFSPEGADYPERFRMHYMQGQEARNNRLIGKALRRLMLLEQNLGDFDDDEPFVIVGGAQPGPNNRMFPQDIRLLSHTRGQWPLMRADGTVTTEIIYSRRKPHFTKNMVTNNRLSTKATTVRSYLTNAAVRTKGFHYDESRIYGIDWDSSYCCTPGNIRGVTVPLLIMGMTGSHEFLAAEQIWENAASTDKTMMFIEGAGHLFEPQKDAERFPGEFGDTVKNCFDYVADWIAAKIE